MIKLFPHDTDTIHPDPAPNCKSLVMAERRLPPVGRPWVMTNMIASADGATSLGGVSGPLGTEADRSMLLAIRNIADAIIVGARTANVERYGIPAATTAASSQTQAKRPTIVVVSASLDIDDDLPLFDHSHYRPIIATTRSAPDSRKTALDARADVVELGDTQVDLNLLMDLLAKRGASIALSEGGPSLNAQLIAEDLIDEWNLTLSPLLLAGDSARPASGVEPLQPPTEMQLSRVWMADDLLFCRWVRVA